jgi:2-oxoglutarate/2-oxoacid ferredoxin oxidoreductase subunit alpha
MGVTEPLTRPAPDQSVEAVVNDFSIAVATANGTGSQTANLTLLRSFFKMGIPVHGKNIFPSNIQGLPTWYNIRVSHQGYIARRPAEILVAYNAATVAEDVATLPSGGVCIFNEELNADTARKDLVYYGVPVKELLKGNPLKGKLRDYVANMTYVGVVAWLLGVSLETVEEALSFHFGRRQKLVDSNMAVVKDSYEWAEANLEKKDPYQVEPMDATEGLILMNGNEAGALGSLFGGATVAAWYPITPSTGFIDSFRAHAPKLRTAPDGTPTYAVVQAEDELAAIGMVIGAGWAGARALTATSGPGISLMSEYVGLGYFAEIPAVIWDVQRVGPSTGLPTRTSQGDLGFAYRLGHGDTCHPVLLPSSIEEAFELGHKALDLADTLQTPIFVLSDLDLGMNNWMGEPFAYPEGPVQRGKVLSAEEVEERGFARYRDVDGDGIPYRTLPGNPNALSAYFARGTGHNDAAFYSERPEDWTENMDRLVKKFDTARTLVPKPVLDTMPGATVGILAFGTTRYAIEEARDQLAAEGVSTDFLRLKALPIGEEVRSFIQGHDLVIVMEMNRDGQLFEILKAECHDCKAHLESIAYLDGMPWTAAWVRERVVATIAEGRS